MCCPMAYSQPSGNIFPRWETARLVPYEGVARKVLADAAELCSLQHVGLGTRRNLISPAFGAGQACLPRRDLRAVGSEHDHVTCFFRPPDCADAWSWLHHAAGLLLPQ